MSSLRSIALGALLLLGPAAAVAQIDSFYLDLERDARTAYVRGDLAGAARLYRVACFGMLDEPAPLAACTVRLASAQAAVKDLEGFRASYLRLATVEERFQGLSKSGLTPEDLKAFAVLAATRVSAAPSDGGDSSLSCSRAPPRPRPAPARVPARRARPGSG